MIDTNDASADGGRDYDVPNFNEVARFQARLESLHLSELDAAAHMLGVNERTIRRWAAGDIPLMWAAGDLLPSRRMIEEFEELEAHMRAAGDDMRRAAADSGVIPIYLRDEELWAAEPWHEPWPARWHRAMAERVAAGMPGARVVWGEGSGPGGWRPS